MYCYQMVPARVTLNDPIIEDHGNTTVSKCISAGTVKPANVDHLYNKDS